MADNSFRAYRGRDDIDSNSPDSVRDPLAELARLIGQTDTAGDYRTSPRREPVQRYEEPVQHYEDDVAPVAPAQGRVAEDRYDDQNQYAEERRAEPQAAEAYPALRDDYPRFSQPEARGPQFDDRYVEPAAGHDFRNAPLAYEDQYQDEPPRPSPPRSRQLPALAPEARDIGAYEHEDGYADAQDQDDGQWHDEAEDQGYAADEYDDETDTAPRRSGLALFLGVIGLVFIGAASAFAYHSMFGGRSFIPSLPPIIKASDSPNKIVPAQAASAGNPGAGDTNTAEKLVPREEQPVPIQPQNAPPRVVATIPVVPQSATLPAAQSANGAQGQSVFPPPPAPAAPPAQPAAVGSAEPKKIHTVTIRTNQPPPANIDPAAQSAPATHAPASVAPKPAPAPKASANAPLSLVPGSQSSAAPVQPPRTQVARAEPANAPLATTPTAASSAPAGGGYSVQVTSQRSEADAETSYKELQAKYPGQLASHHASIRRADLGEKGTYYRAMVGPFASAEAAASMCSSLKAAGGSCIVQRN
jgi:hypothetical protein